MADNDVLTEESVLQLVNQLIGIEAAAREAADSQEQINRQASDDILGQLINQEIDDRQKSLSALQTTVNQSITRIDGNVTQLQLLFNQRYDLMTTIISGLNASFEEKVALLDGLRQTVLLNKSNIEIIQGDENTVGSIAKALFDAKAYTDQKIEEVLDGAPQILDTIKELANAIGNEPNFFANTATSLQSLQQALATESSVRQTTNTETLNAAKLYADSKKLEILNTLSNELIKKTLITITQEHISQGYVVLPDISIVIGSVVAFLNRVAIFENEDFQVSVVEESARLVFLNNLAIGGVEAPEVGEQLRLTYWSL